MGSFFAQPDKDKDASGAGGLQAPALGVTTREQFAPATGASSTPVQSGSEGPAPAPSGGGGSAPAKTPGSAAPSASPAGARAGKPPAFTNISTYLGAQSDSQVGAASKPIESQAQKNIAATAGAGAVAQQAKADVAGGVNRGSVGAPNADGTVDVSRVNLGGYAGPDKESLGARFQQTEAAAQKAADHAAALRSGPVKFNAFDNAVAQRTPAWDKIRAALADESQAATQAGAAAGGVAEAANQARTASDLNADTQRRQLGDAATNLETGAKSNQTFLTQIADDLAAGKIPDLALLQGNRQLLRSIGLAPEQLNALRLLSESGSISPAKLQELLGPYLDAARKATGYSEAQATNANDIARLLNSGKSATANAKGEGNLDYAAEAANNEAAIRTLRTMDTQRQNEEKSAGRWYDFLPGSGLIPTDRTWGGATQETAKRATEAAKNLANAGYTPEQIAQATGLTPEGVNDLLRR